MNYRHLVLLASCIGFAVGICLSGTGTFIYLFDQKMSYKNQKLLWDGKNNTLPVVRIHTEDPRAYDRESKTLSNLTLEEDGIENVFVGVEWKGKSSLRYPKKSYKLEFWKNEQEEDMELELLGMPKHEDWWLRSMYNDVSLVRDAFVLSTWRNMAGDNGEWAPDFRYVEVTVNDQYEGLYMLIEAIKRDKNHRLPLEKSKVDKSPEEIGYLVERESWKSRACFDVWEMDYPKCNDGEKFGPEKKSYIQNKLSNLTNILKQEETTTIEVIESLIDIRSFLDWIIIDEMVKDFDVRGASDFFYVKGANDTRIFAGPLWDFDKSMNPHLPFRPSVEHYRDTNGWTFQTDSGDSLQWWPNLLRVDGMKKLLTDRWKNLRQSHLSDDNITSLIYSLRDISDVSARYNEQRWEMLGRCNLDHSFFKMKASCLENSREEAIDRVIVWLTERTAWIDKNIESIELTEYESHKNVLQVLLRNIRVPISLWVLGGLLLVVSTIFFVILILPQRQPLEQKRMSMNRYRYSKIKL